MMMYSIWKSDYEATQAIYRAPKAAGEKARLRRAKRLAAKQARAIVKRGAVKRGGK